jgi:hypothetical protein
LRFQRLQPKVLKREKHCSLRLNCLRKLWLLLCSSSRIYNCKTFPTDAAALSEAELSQDGALFEDFDWTPAANIPGGLQGNLAEKQVTAAEFRSMMPTTVSKLNPSCGPQIRCCRPTYNNRGIICADCGADISCPKISEGGQKFLNFVSEKLRSE